MPKTVDHDQRRIEIVEATWRIIARGGFSAATMREIASEAGFANGALKPYFATKDDLLAAAYDRTFFLVNERAGAAIGERTGLDAVRLLCLEMLPLDGHRAIESRVAMAFWDRAATSDQLRKLHADSYAIWRHWMENEFAAAERRGALAPVTTITAAVDELLALVAGLRVQAVMATNGRLADDRLPILDRALARLRPEGVTRDAAAAPAAGAAVGPAAGSEPQVLVDRARIGNEVGRRS